MTVLSYALGIYSGLVNQLLGLFLLWMIVQPSPHLLPRSYYVQTALLHAAVSIVLKFFGAHLLFESSLLFVLNVFYCLHLSSGRIRLSLLLPALQRVSIWASAALVALALPFIFPHSSLSEIRHRAFFAVFEVLSAHSLLYFAWGAGILLLYRRRKVASPLHLYALQWITLCAAGLLITSLVLTLHWAAGSHPEDMSFMRDIFPGLSLLMVVCFFMLALSLLYQAGRKYHLQRELVHTRQQLEQQKAIEGMYEEVRAMQHDFENHMHIIGGLAAQQHDEQISAYIRDITGELPARRAAIRTGIPAVDTLLSSKFLHAEKQGISICAEVRFPEPLHISVADLCSAIFNLLDNAIAACESNPSAQKRCLSFDLYPHEAFLVLCCTNPCEVPPIRDKFGFVTTKKGNLHGIGLRQLERIAQKYHGFFHASYEKGIFTAKLVLAHQAKIEQIHTSYLRSQNTQAMPFAHDKTPS